MKIQVQNFDTLSIINAILICLSFGGLIISALTFVALGFFGVGIFFYTIFRSVV